MGKWIQYKRGNRTICHYIGIIPSTNKISWKLNRVSVSPPDDTSNIGEQS